MKRITVIAAAAAALLLLASCNTTGGGPSPSTIAGTVVGAFNAPVVGATVTIGTASTTTDTTGAFSIDNVTPPYDVTVSNAANHWAHVFVGLTSTSPTLLPYGALAGPTPSVTSSATVGGTITGGTTIDSTHPVEVCLEGVTEQVFGCTTLTSSSSYSISAGWLSTSNVAVKVHAIQMVLPSAGAMPSGYAGYGVTGGSTTLVPGGTYSQNLALGSAPTTASLSGTVTAPSSVTSGGVLVFLRLSPQFVIPLADMNLTGASTPYSLSVPAPAGSSYQLVAVGTTSGAPSLRWKASVPAGSGQDLTLPDRPTTVSPPSSAGPGDTFTVGNTGGAPLTVVFFPSTSSTAPVLAVTTSGTSVTMPSVLPVASGTTYGWGAIVNPGESLGQAAGDWIAGYLGLTATSGQLVGADGSFAVSATGSTFTVP